MAIKSSGALAMSEIAAEFGDTGSNLALKNYYRGGIKVPNGPAANANIATSGALSMLSFYGAIAEMQVIITANTTNVNLLSLYTSLFGAPSSPVVARLTINSGVIVGGVGGPALTIGQFPSGSIIAIDNYGSIQGFGGAANSGTGGDAIKADYPNQTITINNKTGGTIYGGGGGAGKGGTGGTGGAGYYNAVGNYGWEYTKVYAGSCTASCQAKYGGSAFDWGDGCQHFLAGYYSYHCGYYYPDNTSGGTGGAGGNGGVGRGYNQAPTAGVTGSSGAAGGTNAGAGGAGGTGGTGGEWGAFGAAGNTGNTGASGNNGSGSAGTAGTAGGSPGKYLIKGAYSVTLNNSGTVAGGLA